MQNRQLQPRLLHPQRLAAIFLTSAIFQATQKKEAQLRHLMFHLRMIRCFLLHLLYPQCLAVMYSPSLLLQIQVTPKKMEQLRHLVFA
ncbi:MAG: hypothetical protein CMM60_11615 [Rhodospirillaceae bacterium]|nr:hypothetical protein [Rhodospirillaceae bacterium]